MLLVVYKYFTAATMIKIHAAKNDKPPNGVIAPRMLIFVNVMTYKLPEKRMIPINIIQPDHDKSELAGKRPSNTPTISNPVA